MQYPSEISQFFSVLNDMQSTGGFIAVSRYAHGPCFYTLHRALKQVLKMLNIPELLKFSFSGPKVAVTYIEKMFAVQNHSTQQIGVHTGGFQIGVHTD